MVLVSSVEVGLLQEDELRLLIANLKDNESELKLQQRS